MPSLRTLDDIELALIDSRGTAMGGEIVALLRDRETALTRGASNRAGQPMLKKKPRGDDK